MVPLSVVIPSYRRADLLQDCLESVCSYAPHGTEIIVVDDGSKNGIISSVAKMFASVQVVRNAVSLGFCGAVNRGISAAQGTIIELLNDDTIVTPGWADSALSEFTDPAIGCVAPLVLIRGNSRQDRVQIDSAGDHYHLGGFARKRFHRKLLKEKNLQREIVFGASASSAFYRADLLRLVGGFPELFQAYFEDVDVSWRIRNAGWKTLFTPHSVVWHHVHGSYQERPELVEQQSRNEERVWWRNVPNKRRHALAHLMTLAGKSFRRLSEGNFRPFLRGRMQAWRELICNTSFDN
ncbi:MAG: glycosyltransferase family 2 protein [Zavarzinella sp.]